jgi:hypothetical protein
MYFYMACVYHKPLHVRVFGQFLKKLFPDKFISPAAKPTMRIAPASIARRQISPRRSRPQNPKYRINKKTIVFRSTSP